MAIQLHNVKVSKSRKKNMVHVEGDVFVQDKHNNSYDDVDPNPSFAHVRIRASSVKSIIVGGLRFVCQASCQASSDGQKLGGAKTPFFRKLRGWKAY